MPVELRPSEVRRKDCTRAISGTVPRRDEHELAERQDDSVEGGALDDEGEGDRVAGEPLTDPVESGGLEREAGTSDLLRRQSGKGYGEDEGEREGSLDGE